AAAAVTASASSVWSRHHDGDPAREHRELPAPRRQPRQAAGGPRAGLAAHLPGGGVGAPPGVGHGGVLRARRADARWARRLLRRAGPCRGTWRRRARALLARARAAAPDAGLDALRGHRWRAG